MLDALPTKFTNTCVDDGNNKQHNLCRCQTHHTRYIKLPYVRTIGRKNLNVMMVT